MTTKRYRLLKDFGLIKEGVVIKWNPGYSQYTGGEWKENHGEMLFFTQKEIDRNPEWFQEIPDQPKQEFVWTDALVQEFANELHVDVMAGMLEISEFKNKKSKSTPPSQPQEDKGWEIVQLTGESSGRIYNKIKGMWLDGNQNGFPISPEDPEGCGCKIHSVRRTSDNTRWTVGDKDYHGNEIKEFKIDGNTMLAICFYTDPSSTYVVTFLHMRPRTPNMPPKNDWEILAFKTSDGIIWRDQAGYFNDGSGVQLEEDLLKEAKIYSVKRLSDGTVWMAGEVVESAYWGKQIIDMFEIQTNYVRVLFHSCSNPLDQLQKFYSQSPTPDKQPPVEDRIEVKVLPGSQYESHGKMYLSLLISNIAGSRVKLSVITQVLEDYLNK